MTVDYKDQIKPIVDLIIKSLFLGENEKPLFKYDYHGLLNDQDKIELCRYLKYKKFRRGETVYTKGSNTKSLYFILNGSAIASYQIQIKHNRRQSFIET